MLKGRPSITLGGMGVKNYFDLDIPKSTHSPTVPDIVIVLESRRVRAYKIRMCSKVDSTICFYVPTAHTAGVAEAEKMFSGEDLLEYEYMLNQRWAVEKMMQSYESDRQLAYIHGFDAGIELLCAKAKLSNPALAKGIVELAAKMAEETAMTLRSMLGKKEQLLQPLPGIRRMTDLETDERQL